MTDKIVNILLKWGLDKASLDKARDGSTKLSDSLKKVEENARKAAEGAEKLQQVAGILAISGAAISAPLLLSARKYLQFVGQTEQASRRWIASTKEIEQAQMRVGRVVATQVTPWMEKAAKIAEKMAGYAERHPGAIGTAVGLGSALVASGGLLTAVSQGIRLVADIKILSAAALQAKAGQMMLTAAGIQAGAAAGMKASTGAGILGSMSGGALAAGGLTGALASIIAFVVPIAIVAAIAYMGYEQVRTKTEYGKKLEPGIVGIFRGARGSIADIEKIIGLKFLGLTDKLGITTGEMNKYAQSIASAGKASKKAAGETVYNEEAIKLYIQAQREEAKAAKQYAYDRQKIEEGYEKNRSEIVANYSRERAKIEQTYEQERTKTVLQYAQERLRAEQDHNREMDRMEAEFQKNQDAAAAEYKKAQADLEASTAEQLQQARIDYNKSLEDLEEQHQENMRKLAEDHNARMDDLAATRDALAMKDEMRSYARQKRDEEESYAKSKADLAEKFAEQRKTIQEEYSKQRAELQANFETQRAQRQAEYEAQVKEAEDQFAIEQQRADEQFQAELKQMDENHRQELNKLAEQYKLELRQLVQAKREQLRELEQAYERERQARNDALRTQTQDVLGIYQEGYDAMVAAAKKYIDALIAEAKRLEAANKATTTAKQAGGYASYGRYLLGEAGTEYVLSARTTQAAERLVGGRLTQSALMSAMLGGKVGATPRSYTVNQLGWRFEGPLTAREKRWFKNIARRESINGLMEAMS